MLYGVEIFGRVSPQVKYALEERDKMIERDGWICWRCGEYLPQSRGQRAHRIARTKPNLKKYGPYVLDHHVNLWHSCSACNSYALRFESAAAREAMLTEIYADLEERGYRPEQIEYQAGRQTMDALKMARRHSREQQERERDLKIKEREKARAKKDKEKVRDRRERGRIRQEKAEAAREKKRAYDREYGRRAREEAYRTGRVKRRPGGNQHFPSAESAAAYRQAYLRLYAFFRRLRDRYGQDADIPGCCTAEQVRKLEKYRTALEALRPGKDT